MTEERTEVLFDSGPLRVVKTVSERRIELGMTYYPLFPHHAAAIRMTIRLDVRDGKLWLNTRSDCQGTEIENSVYARLTEGEVEELAKLMGSVKATDDLERVAAKLDEMRRRRERFAERLFNVLVSELVKAAPQGLGKGKEMLWGAAENFVNRKASPHWHCEWG